jgi:DNA mismatch repair protein MutS2
MSFRCDAATLERLEWHRLASCLAQETATARAAQACTEELFQPTRAGVLERQGETSELRGLLDAGESLPFGGIHDLSQSIADARRGVLLSPQALSEVWATLEATARLAGFLSERRERLPRIADLAGTLPDLRALTREIARVVTPDGEVRDDASPELRALRRRTRALEGEIGAKMASCLRNAELQSHLQDRYVTSRENRPVLPVRAEARGRVPGIVHDVSSSGTTVFIEPEAVVELGNRLRIAQLELDREIERLLRQLTGRVGAEHAQLVALGETLEFLDLAHARARLSLRLTAMAPQLAADAPFQLSELRHPLLLLEAGLTAEQVVANDVRLPEQVRGLVISGPNAGGKTVLAKAIGLAALAVRAGLHVPCSEHSSMPILDAVYADIGDEQDLRSGLSTFSARMSNLAGIIEAADTHALVIVDEIGEGTEPGEGAALAQSILEALVGRGARVIATTHFNSLKELAGTDERFINASAEFDSETLAPTYRVRIGAPGSSGATWVAERMGMGREVIERAQSLIEAEDRKLEALTRSLSELRQELEAERTLAQQMRRETESVRGDYERRLRSLHTAREQALAAMKTELETAFVSARDEIASVMRTLQRGGASDGRAANLAHRTLKEVRERTEAVELQHAEPEGGESRSIDWARVEPGTRLRIEGVASEGVLLEAPDRRGRVVVRLGSTRTTLPAARVQGVLGPPLPQRAPPSHTHLEVERSEAAGPLDSECDLRGLRVDEALDRADAHLQRLLGSGPRRVCFIHGHGTGALRSAIRAWLRELPHVESFDPGGPREGGNGVTIATLTH